MALLKIVVVLLVLAAGCYAPDLGDCTVTCTTDDECAGDQVCTARGVCAGAPAACDGAATTDAGATPMIALRVSVMGDGKVTIVGVGECDPPGGMTSCTLSVPAGPLVLAASSDEKPFDKWTTTVCAGQGATCHVTLTLDASVGAKFK